MKYKTKNSIKVLTGVMICSGLLAACHGGSNGNGNNISNTAVSTTKTANPSQTLLRISNDTGAVIDNVILLSESGHMVHQSNSGLDCANKQSCILDIGGVITDKTMLAKFYNNKNQLISIASLKDNSQKLAYTSIYTNNVIFGAHLFKQLVIFEHSTPAAVLEQLNKYFTANNTDGNHNVFGDLGNYYIQQLKNGQIHNEDQFYKNLSTAFAAHKTISSPVPQASPPLMMAPALGCDPGIGEQVFNWLEPVGKAFEKFQGEVITGFAKAIFNTICPAEEFDFEGAFDKLNEKLDEIQATLEVLGTNVAELRETVVVLNADNVSVKMNTLYNNEIDYNQEYLNFLNETKTKSLSEFMDDRGGIDKLDRSAWQNIFDSNSGIVGGIASQNSNMKLLTSNAVLNQLTDVVKSKCNNPSTITDGGKPADVIAARNKCNMEAVETGLYMATLAQQSKLRMTDVVNVINTAKEPAQFKNNFGEKNKPVTWANVAGVINSDTASRLNNIFTFMREAYIEPTAGLPEWLLTTLKQNYVKCAPSSTTPSGVNGIMEWYGSAATPYIVTSCSNGKEWVSSKFVYSNKAVRNVLGSLSSTTNDQTSAEIETFDKDIFGGHPSYNAHEYVVLADKNMKLAISTYEDGMRSLYTPINNNWKTDQPHWENNPNFTGDHTNKTTFYWNREDGSNSFHTRIPAPNMDGNTYSGDHLREEKYTTSKTIVMNYLKGDVPHIFFVSNSSKTSSPSRKKNPLAALQNKLTLSCGDSLDCASTSDNKRIIIKFSDGTRIRLDGGGRDVRDGLLKLCDVTDRKDDHAEDECKDVVDQANFATVYARGSTSTPGNKLCSTAGCPSTLIANDNKVNSIISDNGEYKLVLQQDGNLVIYNSLKKAVKDCRGQAMNTLLLQNDGNLVAYKSDGSVAWASNTENKGADRLEMQNDGNLVLYRGTTPLWSSNGSWNNHCI